MTSIERHEARYKRRKEKRLQKVHDRNIQYTDFENVFGLNTLMRYAYICRNGVRWKPEVQKYLSNLCINAYDDSNAIANNKWKSKGFHEFDLVERGKKRHIHAVRFAERVVQRSLCDNSIIPILEPTLIRNNAASLPNRGTDFALNELEKHLHEHYQKYGRTGYIYQFDFSGYFKNINVEKLKENVRKYIEPGIVLDMYDKCVSAYTGGGLGLGAQVSQIGAVFYPNLVDHYIKDMCGVRGYGRYMDDGYIICDTMERLQEIINGFKSECAKLDLILNEKKCHIIHFGDNMVFLKTRFTVSESGKVLRKINPKAAPKERHMLRSYKKKYEEGIMTFDEISLLFHSWLCSQLRGMSFNIRVDMIMYFDSLFKGVGEYQLRKHKKKYHDIEYANKIAKRYMRMNIIPY